MNQINVVRPYLWNELWVFDDPAKELDKEALVGGMPEVIAFVTKMAKIEHPEGGFLILFSKDEFNGAVGHMEWVREEKGGNTYRLIGAPFELEGWLCPALLKYFDAPPDKIYFQVKQCKEIEPNSDMAKKKVDDGLAKTCEKLDSLEDSILIQCGEKLLWRLQENMETLSGSWDWLTACIFYPALTNTFELVKKESKKRAEAAGLPLIEWTKLNRKKED